MNGDQTIRFGQILRRIHIEERVHWLSDPWLNRARVTPGEPVDPANALIRHRVAKLMSNRHRP